MAFQKGVIKLKGSIGDLSFYKSKNNGYQVREKSGVDADRIATDPMFQRTRENNAEFKRAMKATKFFKTVFQSLIVKGADSTVSNRLTQVMMKVIKNDLVNDRGERMVLDAETELLQSFEFNVNAPLSSTVLLPYKGIINRLTGSLKVYVPEFVPRTAIFAPTGASHFRLKAVAAMVDFETEATEMMVNVSETLPYDNNFLQSTMIDCLLTPALTKPLFLALGIDFYQRVNGKDYPLNNGARNGLCIIQVSGV